jgi:hypothetical protein
VSESPDNESPADSLIALDSGLRAWAFWIVALTFVWGLLTTIGVKKLGWYQGSALLYAYPSACLIAAAALIRSSSPGRWLFAGLNFACGVGWVAFVIWITHEFAKHFWR